MWRVCDCERQCSSNTISDFPPAGSTRHVLGSPEGQSLDCHGGLTSAGSDQAAAIADEQVGNVVRAMEFVNDR